jgi:hypothetical protein
MKGGGQERRRRKSKDKEAGRGAGGGGMASNGIEWNVPDFSPFGGVWFGLISADFILFYLIPCDTA